MTMMVCVELGKTEQEVGNWGIDDLVRWVAFFRLRNKAEKKAYEEARKRAGKGGKNSNVTTY